MCKLIIFSVQKTKIVRIAILTNKINTVYKSYLKYTDMKY